MRNNESSLNLRKSCFYLIVSMLLAFSNGIADEQKSEQWKGYYRLKIIPKKKTIQVDATIRLQQAYDEIWLEIPTYSFDELISDVHASDEEGNILPLENVSDESYDGWPVTRTLLWRVANVPQTFRLSYKVQIVYRERITDGDDRGVSQHLTPMMSDDYGLITTYALLMAPQRKNLSPSHLEITFDVPTDWEIATLWQAVKANPKTYVLNDFSTFRFTSWGNNAWFALGKFRSHQKTIRGVQLISVICGEEYAFSDATFFALLTKIVNAVMDFYGDKTTPQLFVAVTPWIAKDPKDKGSIAGTITHESRYVVLALSSDIDNKELPEKATLIAHELFHTGNPGSGFPTPKGQAYWFGEGFTKYYEHIIMTRLGFKKPEDFWQAMAQMYQIYEKAYEKFAKPNELSLAACSNQMYRSEQASRMVYEGGATVAFMLDIQIRCVTENARSLDDVMRERFIHSRQHISFKQADFVALLRDISGKDFKDTLTKYVDTAEKVPLNEVLPLIGLEYRDGQIRITSDEVPHQAIRKSITQFSK